MSKGARYKNEFRVYVTLLTRYITVHMYSVHICIPLFSEQKDISWGLNRQDIFLLFVWYSISTKKQLIMKILDKNTVCFLIHYRIPLYSNTGKWYEKVVSLACELKKKFEKSRKTYFRFKSPL